MKTISSHVREVLEDRVFLMQHLSMGLINGSALARHIKPDVESRLGEKASLESIINAILRLEKSMDKISYTNQAGFIGDISLQSGLSIIHFKADEFQISINKAVEQLANSDEFYILTQGIWSAGIIVRTNCVDDLRLDSSNIIERKDELVGVTIKLRNGHEAVLGVCAYIVSLLAQNGVNLEDLISTKDEMTIIVTEPHAAIATRVLMNANKLTA